MSKWHSCYDAAESDEHLADLRLAHDLPSLGSGEYPTPPEELESLWTALDQRFARRTVKDQVNFLSALPADEAAVILERADQEVRDHVVQMLPPSVNQAIARVWNDQSRVSISA